MPEPNRAPWRIAADLEGWAIWALIADLGEIPAAL
jgi:hypothetical protein